MPRVAPRWEKPVPTASSSSTPSRPCGGPALLLLLLLLRLLALAAPSSPEDPEDTRVSNAKPEPGFARVCRLDCPPPGAPRAPHAPSAGSAPPDDWPDWPDWPDWLDWLDWRLSVRMKVFTTSIGVCSDTLYGRFGFGD